MSAASTLRLWALSAILWSVGCNGRVATLVVEEGLRACALPGGGFVDDELPLQARVTFRGGEVALTGARSLELIRTLEVGPRARRATPRAPGRLEREVFRSGSREVSRYRFHQLFEAAGRRYDLRLEFVAMPSDAWFGRPTLTLDARSLTAPSGRFALTGAMVPPDGGLPRQRHFTSCAMEGYQRTVHRLRLANGDEVELHERAMAAWCDPYRPLAVRQMGCVLARWRRGSEVRVVRDYFSLLWTNVAAPAAGPAPPLLYVRFGEPLGGAAGAILRAEDDPEFQDVLFVDGQLRPQATVPVSRHRHVLTAIRCEVPGQRY